MRAIHQGSRRIQNAFKGAGKPVKKSDQQTVNFTLSEHIPEFSEQNRWNIQSTTTTMPVRTTLSIDATKATATTTLIIPIALPTMDKCRVGSIIERILSPNTTMLEAVELDQIDELVKERGTRFVDRVILSGAEYVYVD
jgi:hypothetical protein